MILYNFILLWILCGLLTFLIAYRMEEEPGLSLILSGLAVFILVGPLGLVISVQVAWDYCNVSQRIADILNKPIRFRR